MYRPSPRRKDDSILVSTQGSVSNGSVCISRISSFASNMIYECLFPMVLHEMKTQSFAVLMSIKV